MLRDENFQLADELRVPARVQVRVDPFLERREAELLELRDVGLSKRLEGEISKSRSAPQCERLTQLARFLFRVQSPCLLHKPPEGFEVELTGPNVDAVTRCLRLEDVGAEGLTQLRDEVLQRGH